MSAFLKLYSGQFVMHLLYDEALDSPDDFTMTVDETKILHLNTKNGFRLEQRYFNQISNSEFLDPGNIPWRYSISGGTFKRVDVNFSAVTTLEGAGTAYAFLEQSQPAITLEYVDTGAAEYVLPVQPNEKLCFSGYLGAHRCKARLIVVFLDVANRTIAQQEAGLTENVPGGKQIEDYERVAVIAVAPAGAKAAVMRISVELQPSASNGFFFFTRLWLGRVAGTEAVPWSLSLADLFGPSRTPSAAASYVCVTIPIPHDCLDGTLHTIKMMSGRTGCDVEGSPLTVLRKVSVIGEITDVSGGVVHAQLSLEPPPELQPKIELLIDQEPAGTATVHGEAIQRSVNLTIPSQFCDGRPHVFTIRMCDSGQVLAQMPAFSPTAITPFESLQVYAGPPIDAWLSPAARARYQALLDNLGANHNGAQLKWLHDRLLRGPVAELRYEPLSFDCPANPLISIVIPARDHFETTYLCLCSLLFNYNDAGFEVIVVDDGSTDETANLEEIALGVQVVRHAKPTGFVHACNDGARAAHGEYVVFLNNDTELTTHWLDEMLYVFNRFDAIGLVGARLLYPDGSQQEAGGIVWETGNPWNYGRKANPAAPQYSYTRQVDYVSGAAIMVSRRVWEEVQGFSEEFAPAYFEDTDLAFKIRSRGLKTVFAPFSVVYHREGVSSGTSTNSGIKRFQEVNRPRFKRKWSSAYQNNGREGEGVDLVKDRGVRYRALMIDFEMPRPDFDAGSYAVIQNIRALQALGFKVTFLPTNFSYLGRHTERLQRMGVETLYAPFANSVDSVLAERGAEFDLIYVIRYQVAEQVAESVHRRAPNAKFVLDVCDLHFLRELRSSLLGAGGEVPEQVLQMREAELAALRHVDLAMTYSPVEEAVILSHNLHMTKVALLPWIAQSHPVTVPFAERRNISFLGGFRHLPNTEAVEFFIEQVIPKLTTELSGVMFEIYGSAISPENKVKWTRDNVIVQGPVPELETLFDRTRVFVAPLLSGAGVKGKVFDCLSYGVPSVISPVAAEAIGLRDGHETLIAATPDEWVSKVKRIYTDEDMWQKMSSAGREFVDAHHSFARGVELMRRALEKVGLFCDADHGYLVCNICRP